MTKEEVKLQHEFEDSARVVPEVKLPLERLDHGETAGPSLRTDTRNDDVSH